MPKLTAQYVRDLPFAEAGQTLVTDDPLPGFGVRVGARSKSYFAESRVKGRTRRVTITGKGSLVPRPWRQSTTLPGSWIR